MSVFLMYFQISRPKNLDEARRPSFKIYVIIPDNNKQMGKNRYVNGRGVGT